MLNVQVAQVVSHDVYRRGSSAPLAGWHQTVVMYHDVKICPNWLVEIDMFLVKDGAARCNSDKLVRKSDVVYSVKLEV